jgi:preprotein translocase subunit SecF
MEFFKTNTNINFMGLAKFAAIFSICVVLSALISLFVNGLDFGLDFTGGTEIQLGFQHPADVSDVREKLTSSGFDKIQVQSYGDARTVLVTLAPNKKVSQENQKKEQDKLSNSVMHIIPDAKLEGVTFIGAKVSSELAYKGALAVIVAMIATMIYIALRFEYRIALSAGLSLLHDPIVILGVFSFFKIQFDLTSLAAVLTVIGYSLNDTIVVADRIRENFRKMRRETPSNIVNSAVNQTLSRTIMSSTLVFVVVACLFVFGGPVIHSFALAILIGIVIGTYSSIYVVGALAVYMGLSRNDLLVSTKKEHDEE